MSLCWVSSADWFPFIFTRAMNSVEGVFGRLRTPYKKLIMGGAMLSILIFLFPTVVWRRLRYDRIVAEWDEQCRMGHGDE